MQKSIDSGFLELGLVSKTLSQQLSSGKKVTTKENFLKLEAEISKAATKGFLKKIQHQE